MEQSKVVIKRFRRKQHSSCDQCRRAKRACDAAWRAEHIETKGGQHFSTTTHSAGQNGKHQIPRTNCSNCQKNGRNCTFEWLQYSMPKSNKGNIKHKHSDGRTGFSTELPRRTLKATSFPQDTTLAWSSIQKRNSFLPWPNVDWDNFGSQQLQPSGAPNAWRDSPIHFDPPPLLESFSDPSTEASDSCYSFPIEASTNTTAVNEDDIWNAQHEMSEFRLDTNGSALADIDMLLPQTEFQDELRLPGVEDNFTPSFFLADKVSSAINRLSLSQNWLRVYHDSLENALSCWLTERNCPYSEKTQDRRTRISNFSAADTVAGEWGPKWSNRIYARVCRLDQVSSSLPGKPLTTLQQSKASKALNLSIMSFGVQWAQAGSRGDLRSHSAKFGSNLDLQEEMHLPSSDEFGRSMQETLWNQTRQALQDAAGVQSYKVVFANIVFSLTQKPLNVAEWSPSERQPPVGHFQNGFSSTEPNMTAQSHFEPGYSHQNDLKAKREALQDILNADGPPIYLEAALRELVSSRWKWGEQSRQRLKGSSQNIDIMTPGLTTSSAGALSREHQETFKLLSWLAIMFDTISAAVLQRPTVISDEDSGLAASDPWKGRTPLSSLNHSEQNSIDSAMNIDLDGWQPSFQQLIEGMETTDGDVWGNLFLERNGPPTIPSFNEGMWSCTFEEAAAILCDAAPVKVLLFRRVGHIQKLMTRKANAQALETAFEEALSVYNFWNKSYGRFIEQCIQNHHDLPSRIQSWYIVLAGHWHLGALLLADVVDEMDEAGLGLGGQQQKRRISTLSYDLRRKNAVSVSELCRCSLEGPVLSFTGAREFNYPVNQVALLSEPWTVVLIQSFSRAGYVFLSQLGSPQKLRSTSRLSYDDERTLAKRRCGSCIDGLLNLGNKSDMAFLAAKFLRDNLRSAGGW